jgi:hypothetical protein
VTSGLPVIVDRMMLIVLLLNMTVLVFSLQLVHEKNGMFVNYSGFNFFFWGGGGGGVHLI